MEKIIKVNCQGADNLPLDDLLDFQGDLKILKDVDCKKLKKIIIKHGITAPIHIWKQTSGKTAKNTKYILDGHQRVKVLKLLRKEGYKIPDLPVIYVKAANRESAKEILLAHVSSYGKVTREGLDMFMLDAGLTSQDIGELMSIDNMSFDEAKNEPTMHEEKLTPYNKVNFLITFSPSLFNKVSPLLEQIFEIEGVEYEQNTI